MATQKFNITYGEIRAAARINSTRDHLKSHNYFPTESSEKAEFYRALAGDNRTLDGSANEPSQPHMGMVGKAFSRNTPPAGRPADLAIDAPDPRVVSEKLLHNKGTQTLAPGINLLAAAWIQFQVHDWVEHKTNPQDEIRLAATANLDPLTVEATEEVSHDGTAPTYANTQGHWWDGSQLYGNDLSIANSLRLKDKTLLRAELNLPSSMLPTDSDGAEQSGFTNNWWLGLSIFHTLFAREHNQIVAKLRGTSKSTSKKSAQEYEDWLFDKARLINSAVMAKVHTVEWTPALLDTPVGKLGMYADWWGQGTENANNLFGAFAHFAALKGFGDDEPVTVDHLKAMRDMFKPFASFFDVVIKLFADGEIPNRSQPSEHELGPDHQPFEYAMSEEFVAVYRMHALLPEKVALNSSNGTSDYSLEEVSFNNTRTVLEDVGLDQAFHSFATQPPAALRLRNFPGSLTDLKLPDKEARVDLGAIDILRDRERGIPRYAAFRRHVTQFSGPEVYAERAKEITTFSDICGDPNEPNIDGVEQARRKADAELLASVYNSPEEVDLQIGMLAEPLPAGFGFSWTAFEIFLLMAVFRLSRDRFFTYDYREEIYTKTGIDWINQSNLKEVLKRNTSLDLDNILFPDPTDDLANNLFSIESWR